MMTLQARIWLAFPESNVDCISSVSILLCIHADQESLRYVNVLDRFNSLYDSEVRSTGIPSKAFYGMVRSDTYIGFFFHKITPVVQQSKERVSFSVAVFEIKK